MGTICAPCLKWRCTECVRAYTAGDIAVDRIARRLRERNATHTCCQSHLPAADRLRRGLHSKSRTPIARILTKFIRLRITKKTRRPSGKGLCRQRRPACTVVADGVQCTERGRPEEPYNGKCNKHLRWEQYGRLGLHAALVSIDEVRDTLVPRHGLNHHSGVLRPSSLQARFAHTCSFCTAQHFSEERIRHGKLLTPSLCCLHGKLQHVECVPRVPYPLPVSMQMSALRTNSDFQRDIRRYNAAMSFVSFADTGGNVTRHLPGKGPYTYVIQGQVYHSMPSLEPPLDQERKYGQLYFYAPDEALDKRLFIFDGLERGVLEKTQGILYYDICTSSAQCSTAVQQSRYFNPYVGAFHHMFTIWASSTADQKLVRFQFKTGVTPDPRRYNSPSAAEVAAIYDGDAPPTWRGICVYPTPTASGSSTYRPSFLSDHRDPLAYPLLFPDGQKGWHSRLPYFSAPSSAKGARLFISQAEFYSHRLMTRDPVQAQGYIHFTSAVSFSSCSLFIFDTCVCLSLLRFANGSKHGPLPESAYCSVHVTALQSMKSATKLNSMPNHINK